MKYEVVVESSALDHAIIMDNVEIINGILLHGTVIGSRTKSGDYKKYNTPLDFKTNCRFTMKEFIGVLE